MTSLGEMAVLQIAKIDLGKDEWCSVEALGFIPRLNVVRPLEPAVQAWFSCVMKDEY